MQLPIVSINVALFQIIEKILLMLVKRVLTFCVVSITLLQHTSAQDKKTLQVKMNKVQVTFALDEKGTPTYAVDYSGTAVVLPSRLGFNLIDDSTSNTSFHLIASDNKSVDE